MKLAIVGQQDFGKNVLEAFLERGDEVAGVFCAPEKPGARPDALKTAAEAKGVKVFQFASLKSDEPVLIRGVPMVEGDENGTTVKLRASGER